MEPSVESPYEVAVRAHCHLVWGLASGQSEEGIPPEVQQLLYCLKVLVQHGFHEGSGGEVSACLASRIRVRVVL